MPPWSAYGTTAGALFGGSIATAGDVNGDGFADLIVGSAEHDIPSFQNVGRAVVFHGSPTGLSSFQNWEVIGDQASAELGFSVASAGDVNGDGFGDVIMGSRNSASAQAIGSPRVYHGSATGLAATPAWVGPLNSPGGLSVASSGDLNGDNYDDIVVGNPISTFGTADIYYGSSTGVSTTPTLTLTGPSGGSEFGWCVASAGDVNSDGYDDLLIAAPRATNIQSFEGHVYLYHGSATGITSTPNWVSESNLQEVGYGFSVAGAGDVNGDTFDDIIIGAPFLPFSGPNRGRAFVHYGSASGLSATPNWTGFGVGNSMLGSDVATAGDVNNDGYADILTAEPLYAEQGIGNGRVNLHLGSANGPSLTADRSIKNIRPYGGGRFSESIATAGDVNNDGAADIALSAPDFYNPANNNGQVYLYHGIPASSSVSDWTLY